MSKIDKYLNSGIVFTPVVVSYLVQNKKVLLGLRKKVSLGLGENLLVGIGGKVGDQPEYKDETTEQALVREVKEEICVTVTSYKKMGRVRFIFPHKPKWNQEVTVYVVDKWEGDPKETEPIKPMWFNIKELPTSRMWDDNAYWVPKVLLGEQIDAIFLYGEDNKVVESVFKQPVH